MDGYGIVLAGDTEDRRRLLRLLQHEKWIDAQTRAVSVQYIVRNGNWLSFVALVVDTPTLQPALM